MSSTNLKRWGSKLQSVRAPKQPMNSAKNVFKPHKYQMKTIKFFISRPAAGAFLDPGLGKTVITYSAFKILKDAGYVKKLLVVTLLRPAYKVWPSEIDKWRLDLKHVILHGGKKNTVATTKDADVYIINYDGLPWLANLIEQTNLPWLKDCMLVFDESSKLRNTNTQRFKIVRSLLGRFKRRYILTGSPTPKGRKNLFGQIYVLDCGERLGKYVTHFRNQYMIGTSLGAGGPVLYNELKPGAAEQIDKKISDIVIRFGEEELDMPKLIPRTIKVDLPRKARIVYDDLERDLITAIDNNIIVAKNAGVATQKLRQVANGGIYLQDGVEDVRRWQLMHEAKTEAVLEILEGLEGQPTLIGFEFEHDYQRLRKVLPNVPCFTNVTIKEYGKLEDRWNRGEIDCALAQIHALSHGNNLQGGRAVILHSLVWDFEAYDQFIRRVYRQGQKAKRVFVYHIVTENTIDEVVLETLKTNNADQQDFFKSMKNYMRQRKK